MTGLVKTYAEAIESQSVPPLIVCGDSYNPRVLARVQAARNTVCFCGCNLIFLI